MSDAGRQSQVEAKCTSEDEKQVFQNQCKPAPGKKKSRPRKTRRKAISRWFHYISNALYFLSLIIIIFVVFIISTKTENTGSPRLIFGYSYLTVLTSSMQSEIPKGSLILVKQVGAEKISVGDVITYMRDESTSITHKVIDIYEDFQETGKRGFQTKGVNNNDPDDTIVIQDNVVGVVIAHIPNLGMFLSYVKDNVFIFIVIFVLFILLLFSLRLLFAPPKAKRKRKKARRAQPREAQPHIKALISKTC